MNYTRLLFLFAFGLLCTSAACAETDLAGDWRGKLAVGATSLPVQFTFTKKPDGSFSALLNSLENENIKNVPASAVSWKDGALKVDVPSLTGSYTGTFKDDHFEGQWGQAGSKPIPLALARVPKASRADLEMLSASWHGPLPAPAKGTAIFEFRPDAQGDLTGTFSVPEQGMSFPMAELQIGPGEVSFKVPQIGSEYAGTYTGSAINGVLRQGGASLPINLTKGAAATRFYPLKLDAEQFGALYGDWKAKLGQFDCVLHFTVGPGNSFAAFLDVVAPKSTVPVTDATGTGKKVVLKIASLQGEFTGELTGKTTLAGQWVQNGQSTPVTWTKQ
jgi:hypothetical protein